MARGSSNHGVMVNRLFAADVRVVQLVVDHEIGGFVVIAELDEDPPSLQLYAIVGYALAYEEDAGDAVSTVLLVTYDGSGTFEFWDAEGAAGEEFLGVHASADPAVIERLQGIATSRLTALRERSRAAEAQLHGVDEGKGRKEARPDDLIGRLGVRVT